MSPSAEPPAPSAARAELLGRIALRLRAGQAHHPLRVGIDGLCGVGKSTFARELAGVLGTLGHPVVHVDSDGFHHVRARRHRNTQDPARGYYEDAYDLDSLAERVLRPLGPGGDRRYAEAVHDLRTDAVIEGAWAIAPSDAVVLVDATFLQATRLEGLWDEVIWLDAPEAVAQARGVARDAAALGGPEAAATAYRTRYLAACRLYLSERRPRDRASIVIDHTDPAAPVITRLGPAGSRAGVQIADG